MTELRVKNWSEFQHYKDRHPVWIKLYLNLLDNYEFGQLTDAERGQLVMIWMLAAKSDGRLPNDPKWIASRIVTRGRVRLQRFLDLGFLEVAEPEQPASESLAESEQDACLEERRGETEERRGDTTATAREAFVALVPLEYRPDVEAAIRASSRPDALVASLRMIVEGGEAVAYDHATIGQALREIAVAGRPITVNTIRAYCRNVGGRVSRETARADAETPGERVLRLAEEQDRAA